MRHTDTWQHCGGQAPIYLAYACNGVLRLLLHPITDHSPTGGVSIFAWTLSAVFAKSIACQLPVGLGDGPEFSQERRDGSLLGRPCVLRVDSNT